MDITLALLAAQLNGKVVQGDPQKHVSGMTSMTSMCGSHRAFVVGRHLPEATVRRLMQRGVTIITDRAPAHGLGAKGGVILARSPRLAFQQFVRRYRTALGIPVVAITGTAGKTTTKEMLLAIVRRKIAVVASAYSYNIDPAPVILSAKKTTKAIILEMGMGGPRQISYQCYLAAAPNIGIITNVGRGHVAGCGGFSGVVKAKNEMVYGVNPNGVLVLNRDDAGTKLLKISQFRGKIIWIGKAPDSTYRIADIQRQSSGFSFTVHVEGTQHHLFIPGVGEHLIYDAVAAAAAARSLGLSWLEIHDGLASFKQPRGRLYVRRGLNGSRIIDDSFNANPLSVGAGLKALKEATRGKRSIAVLGDMEQQGNEWAQAHEGVGRQIAELGIDYLVTVGPKAAYMAKGAIAAGMPKAKVHSTLSRTSALIHLRKIITADSYVLIKGSHKTQSYLLVKGLT